MKLTRRRTLSLCAAAMATPLLAPTLSMKALAQETGMADPDYIETNQGSISIFPIAHASLALAAPGLTLYADPVGEAAQYDGLPPADIILITHEHGDHYNADTLGALAGENTQLITNPAVYGMLPADMQARATQLANGESHEASGMLVDAIPAYNTTAERLDYHPEGRDNGYVLTLAGARIYIAGDTEDIPEMRALSDIALAFVPMNLPFTMDVDQAASAVIEFAPAVVYPYHYRGSDVEQFKANVEAANGTTEVRLGPWY